FLLSASATPEIYTLPLHDALPISTPPVHREMVLPGCVNEDFEESAAGSISTTGQLNGWSVYSGNMSSLPSNVNNCNLPLANNARSEEHTSESSHVKISYAVFCLKK